MATMDYENENGRYDGMLSLSSLLLIAPSSEKLLFPSGA